MKQFYLFTIFLVTNLLFAQTQNYHDTQGKFDVSEGGQSTYTLPIALPASIQNVGPTVNLVYTSGQMGGIAGQGWNLSAISTISRIATRRDIDGFVDGVDFDDNDKLALDGQRLLLKTGTYWSAGSTYQTEVQSNTKIELFGNGATIYFVVTAPDGSKSIYGGSSSSDLVNFYINRFEDTKGNFIIYNYNKPLNKSTCINEILFSANVFSNTTPLNKIKFNYAAAQRIENTYVNGVLVEKAEILKDIQVFTDRLLFKKYQLTQTTVDCKYERIAKIQEFNGVDSVGANPIVFEYGSSQNGVTETMYYSNPSIGQNFNGFTFVGAQITGDFTGEGEIDFIKDNKFYRNRLTQNIPPTTVVLGEKNYIFNLYKSNFKYQQNAVLAINENLDNVQMSQVNLFGGATDPDAVAKIIAIDNAGVSSSTCQPWHVTQTLYTKKSNIYYVGDFNADGISEVLLLAFNDYKSSELVSWNDGNGDSGGNPQTNDVCIETQTIETTAIKDLKVIDLNPTAPTLEGSSGNSTIILNKNWLVGDTRHIMDFNGDGKDDVLVIKNNGEYKVVCLKQLLVAPWVELELLGQGNLDGYNVRRPLLFGDFNGDSRIDMMNPMDTGGSQSWFLHTCKPQSETDTFFITSVCYTGVVYKPFDEGTTWKDWFQYLAMDSNKDGKTDLVVFKTTSYYVDDLIQGRVYRTGYQIFEYLKRDTNSFYLNFSNPDLIVSNTTSVPTLIGLSYKKNDINHDLMMVRPGQYNDTWDAIITVDFNKNIQRDNHLSKVSQSNGAIVDEITYKPVEAINPSYECPSYVFYPNFCVKRMPNLLVVTSIKNTSLGISKYQNFKYFNFILNYSGLGCLGFEKTARSSWYINNSDQKIWSATERDLYNRFAVTRFYSVLQSTTADFSFSNYQNYISQTQNIYNPTLNQFPYVRTLKTQISIDYITNVQNSKIFEYSTDGFYLPIFSFTRNSIGLIIDGDYVTKTEYYPNSFGIGNNYFIGRPKSIVTINSAYGDTKSNSEELTYEGSNVKTIVKKAGTSEISLSSAVENIIETMAYFPNGNLQSKTLSASGFVENGTARNTSFTYDNTSRFIKTSTDVEGLTTTYTSFDPRYGTIISQTNPFGQTTSSTFDNWGKKMTVTDFLGKTLNYNYTRADNMFTVREIGADASESGVVTDALNRVILKFSKDLNGQLVKTSTNYDWKGQVLSISAPYFAFSGPSMFSLAEYDAYGRTTKNTLQTGKVITYEFTGLTTSTIEDGIVRKTTKNANGHVIKTSEKAIGETPNNILYNYDANGNLLTSKFGNIGMTMEYDLWSRKTKLIDPSAGTYSYTYDAFGAMLTEDAPKGKTTIVYNSVGKPLSKHVVGLTAADQTDILTEFDYDPTYKWLSRMVVTNPNDLSVKYNYKYDIVGFNPTYQLKTTSESDSNSGMSFTKDFTFDDFGRIATTTLSAKIDGKSSVKTTFNVYANGVLKETRENDTNGNLIWKADAVNANGQVTLGQFGNGTTIANTYDAYGYFQQKKLYNPNDTSVNLLKIDYEFEPTKGLLNKRTNNFCNIDEIFTYDNQERLTSWTGSKQDKIVDCKFTQSLEDFQIVGSGGTLINEGDSLLVVQCDAEEIVVEKLLLRNAKAGIVLKISADAGINRNARSGGEIYITERDPITNEETSYPPVDLNEMCDNHEASFSVEYVVSSNSNIYINFKVTQDFTYGHTTEFAYLDNLLVVKVETGTQTYDSKGRIRSNEVGNYGYPTSGKIFQNNTIQLSSDALPYYVDQRKAQLITYNAFKCPIDIYEFGREHISFGYNGAQGRSVMYYGDDSTDKFSRPFRKYYSADGSMEIKQTIANGTTPASYEFATYLGGDAYSAPAAIISDGTTQTMFYLHRDNQSSILAVSKDTGEIVEKRLFDPWGQLIGFEKHGQYIPVEQISTANGIFLDRGYTGHEHLLGVGLINMNARLYDPKLRRFLQTDNEAQDPSKAQDYNRYGYCLNNPLKYSDPSGNNPIGIAIAVAVIRYLAVSAINHQPMTLGGIMSTAVFSGFSAAVSFGIGEMTSTIVGLALKTTVQAISHAVTQGGIAYIQGGNFWNAAAAGVTSSLASSAWAGGDTSQGQWGGIGGRFAQSGAGIIIFGTIAGGAGAVLSGGNFWEGASIGLIVSGLNHALHDSPNKRLIRKLNREIDKTFGARADREYGLSYDGGATDADVDKALNIDTIKTIRGNSGNPAVVNMNADNDADGTYKSVIEDTQGGVLAAAQPGQAGTIRLYGGAFSSPRHLVHTILHELGHAYSRYTGNFLSAYNSRGWSGAVALDEVFAYTWGSCFGQTMFVAPGVPQKGLGKALGVLGL